MNRDELDYLFERMRNLPETSKQNLLCDLFAKMEGAQQVNGAYFPIDFFYMVQEETDYIKEREAHAGLISEI